MTPTFGATAYISYARKDEARVRVVSQLKQSCIDSWIQLKVDEDEVKPRESFEDFINEIGSAACVIVVFSESYLSSFYCMLELTRIVNDPAKRDGVLHYAYPIFAEDNFRLDGARQKWKSFWQDKFDSWQRPDADEEVTDAYGSEAECREILDSLDLVFDTFSRNLAGQAPACNAAVIEWVKQTYFQRIQRNPAFKQSIFTLRSCHERTRQLLNTVIDQHIESAGGEVGELDDQPEKLVPYLVQLPLPELFRVFDKAQEFTQAQSSGAMASGCMQELSDLLQLLVPLLFQPESVEKLRIKRPQLGCGVVCIPCASEVSAEILMAGVDKRATDFQYTTLKSGQSRLIPGKYCLPLPPETGGENIGDGLHDAQTDLAQRMGLSSLDSELFDLFIADENVSPDDHHKFVRQELEFLRENGEPGYYWIFNTGAAIDSGYWSKLADQLSQRYPEILMLSLDTSKQLEERGFLRLLHKIVPRHLTYEG